MNDKNIFVAIDMSGSMYDLREHAKSFLKLLCSQYKGKWPIVVIEFTDKIQNVYNIKSYKDFDPDRGSYIGGTYYTRVIEFMNKNIVPEEFKDFRICAPSNNDVLYIFTDGFGEWDLPKPLFGELNWVIPDKYLIGGVCVFNNMRKYGSVLTERLDVVYPACEISLDETKDSALDEKYKILEELENELIERASEFTPTDYKIFYHMIQELKKKK